MLQMIGSTYVHPGKLSRSDNPKSDLPDFPSFPQVAGIVVLGTPTKSMRVHSNEMMWESPVIPQIKNKSKMTHDAKPLKPCCTIWGVCLHLQFIFEPTHRQFLVCFPGMF